MKATSTTVDIHVRRVKGVNHFQIRTRSLLTPKKCTLFWRKILDFHAFKCHMHQPHCRPNWQKKGNKIAGAFHIPLENKTVIGSGERARCAMEIGNQITSSHAKRFQVWLAPKSSSTFSNCSINNRFRAKAICIYSKSRSLSLSPPAVCKTNREVCSHAHMGSCLNR